VQTTRDRERSTAKHRRHTEEFKATTEVVEIIENSPSVIHRMDANQRRKKSPKRLLEAAALV
jgi:hypothetical protein